MVRKHKGGCGGCFGQAIVGILLVLAVCWVWNHRSNIMELLFPTDHLQIVETECAKYDLDPWLVMAMIRTESHFDNDAVSHAGAYGLMQLLPGTAAWIVSKSGLEITPEAALCEPKANIQAGIWYLDWLNQRYEGNIFAAIAAYNAGQSNVDQWLADQEWDGSLENSEQIPYEETANYLRSVWRSYKIYNILRD